MLAGDAARHTRAIREAATRMAPGFKITDVADRERQMRRLLRRLKNGPKGISALAASPMSFFAVVGADGFVIAREREPDHMKGLDFGNMFPVVRTALQGQAGSAIVEFPPVPGAALDAAEKNEEPSTPAAPPPDPNAPKGSVSWMFSGPIRGEDGSIVGALALGIPLIRLEQRITNQLRLDHASELSKGLILWAYVYHGPHLFSRPFQHVELDTVVPSLADRRAGIARSPGGFTTERDLLRRWYAFGVVPLPFIAEDFGVLVVRSDPP